MSLQSRPRRGDRFGRVVKRGDVFELIIDENYQRFFDALASPAVASGGDGLGADGDKGDITVGGVGTTLTIDPNAVTYAKLQDVSATARFLGRITAGAGDVEELTGTQATTLLDVFTAALKGLVPASGGGTTTFLRADGTFASPVAMTSVDVAFTDGDTMRRVTIADAAVTAASKIIGTVVRPDQADEASDKGYLYLWNITRRAAGAFDVVVSCLGWGFDDPVLDPPNETIKFIYTVG